jgi:hypothetical protein
MALANCRPMPNMSRAELAKILDTLTDDQRDEIEDCFPEPWFSSRSTMAEYYQEAIRRGWIMGPA